MKAGIIREIKAYSATHKDKPFAKELLDNRALRVNEYLKKDRLSILDLCRIFEVTPLGMRKFLEEYKILGDPRISRKHHPARVSKILEKRFWTKDGERRYISCLEEGLPKDPWIHETSVHELKKEEQIIELYKKHVPAALRKQLEQMNLYISIKVPDSFCVVIELALLGFKKTDIVDYVTAKEEGWEKIPDAWIAALIEYSESLIVKKTIKLKMKSGDTYKRTCKQIASNGVLESLMVAGASDVQIRMITGDQLPVIADVRKSEKKQKYIDIQRDGASEKAFMRYISDSKVTLTQIAMEMGFSRQKVMHLVNNYAETRATPEERAIYAKKPKKRKNKAYKEITG